MNEIELFCGVCFANTIEYVAFNEPCPSKSSAHNSAEDNTNTKCITYYDCFLYCTNSKIVCETNLPQILCLECAKELEITYTFLCKAKQAELLYTQAIAKLNGKDESSEVQHSSLEDNEEMLDDECLNVTADSFEAIEESNVDTNAASVDSEDIAWLSSDEANISEAQLQVENYDDDTFEIEATTTPIVTSITKEQSVNQTHFTCEICGKTYTRRNRYNAHLRYHERKRTNSTLDTCQICYKQFVTPHYLRQHMAVHCDQRQLYECSECNKLYYSKTALENHMRIHRGNAIVCNICRKQFSRRYEFNVHMRFHKKVYPFACTLCDKKFTIKGHLRTHMWRHQGLKLQCDDCGKLFTSTKALNEHSYTHTAMPFNCLYCERGYPSRQKYKVHLKSAHEIEFDAKVEQQINATKVAKPLQRRKLTLVHVDNAMREIEVVAEESNNDECYELLDVNLCD